MICRQHDLTTSSRGILILALAVVCACPAMAQPEGATAPPDTADNFTGTILFINGRPQESLPVEIAELRAAGISRLEAALRGAGHQTLDRALIENKVVKWRVRGSHLVSPEFLSELKDEDNVGQILVATLLSDNSRFLMTARLIDTGTGRVTFVNLVDVDLPVDSVIENPGAAPEWLMILDRICLEVVPPWAPPSTPLDDALLVLPTRGIACDPALTSAAAHSLLKVLIGQGLDLIDPALTEVTMLEAGRPSYWLDARGRRALQGRFQRDTILISELVSYDRNNSQNAYLAFDAELAGPGRRNLTVFALTLRTVDLNTGTAIRSAQIIHEKPPATGWFGNPIHTTLLQELETTSNMLWAKFSPDAEDN